MRRPGPPRGPARGAPCSATPHPPRRPVPGAGAGRPPRLRPGANAHISARASAARRPARNVLLVNSHLPPGCPAPRRRRFEPGMEQPGPVSRPSSRYAARLRLHSFCGRTTHSGPPKTWSPAGRSLQGRYRRPTAFPRPVPRAGIEPALRRRFGDGSAQIRRIAALPSPNFPSTDHPADKPRLATLTTRRPPAVTRLSGATTTSEEPIPHLVVTRTALRQGRVGPARTGSASPAGRGGGTPPPARREKFVLALPSPRRH